MRIAGLQKLSLVDYPGKLCSVVFVQGCNFRCGYCQNPDLVTCDKHFDCSEQEILEFLSRRKNMIEAVVVTGGEPVIYEDLPEFIKKIRETNLSVKLDTNGSDPARIKKLLDENLLDYIALDIKTAFSKYPLVTGIKDIGESVTCVIRDLMASGVPYEFRTTCAPGIIDEKDFIEIGRAVKGAAKYCLQQFRPQVTLDPKFLEISPYDKKTIEKFKDILSGFVENVQVRGV